MKIHVTMQSAEWYREELDVDNSYIRLFVRYGGVGGRIPGFSLGINFEEPVSPIASLTMDGLHFFIEETDAWYFDNFDVNISLDEELDEPRFTYH